jgi:hypothetical protein
LSTG